MIQPLQWLKDIQNSAQGTIELRRACLTRFLESFDGGLSTQKPAHLSPGEVQIFFLEYAKSHGKASRRSTQAALRTFFRFCYAKGYVGRDLSAGLEATRRGSHAFRHGFATRMLANGHPLKSLANMLGHRCIQTTAVYTKVDFQTLNLVPLDWPEVIS